MTAEKLLQSGLKTISISIDGLEETHDVFRGRKGAYNRAMEGVQNLIHQGGLEHIQITTVVHKKNIQELEALYDLLKEMAIDSWRLVSIEPIGRARKLKDYFLDAKEQCQLMFKLKDVEEEMV